ncbi:MAG: ATP synthase F1 subunit gamma [Thermoguttaceae bacterium]|jgi:F-type H+-transporting ATPase subunit gamma
MAKARALDRRRKSIRNIRKITRTMELISTARFKRAMDRATAATAYTRRITALVGHLQASGLELSHPLLEPRAETAEATLLVLTGNRGLCGGYNSGVLRLAVARLQELRDHASRGARAGRVRLEVSGKRGISAFRFRRIELEERFTHFEDKPAFGEVEVLANRYLEAYVAGRLDRLDVAYTRFESLSRQHAAVETLLPLGAVEAGEPGPGAESLYELLPTAADILEEILPASFKVRLLKCFLDAAVSEQIARMMAMKNATENADAMIGTLSVAYNRARQTQITGELLEIIGGAEALKK